MCKMFKFKINFKSISFILSLLAIILCIVNLMGYDDKNRFLLIFSPPLWIFKAGWFANSIGSYKEMPLLIKYVLTITFWSLLGARIDKKRGK